MRVLIVAVGTRGDVAPYTGLGSRLRAAGHEVAIAAYPVFADMITECGLEFRPLPGDPTAPDSWTQMQHDGKTGTGPVGMLKMLRAEAEDSLRTARDIHRAAEQGTDVMLLSLPGILGYHVAEALGIPSMGVFMQPIFPTTAHPSATSVVSSDLGGLGNKASGHLGILSMGVMFSGVIKRLRAELGLPVLSGSALTHRLAHWPVQHCYSPSVLPRPEDWCANHQVPGYLWPDRPAEWQPSPELAEFLAADGDPLVYVGFGSRALKDGPRVSRIVDAALTRAGVRGVIQAGWADLASRSDRAITIDEAPHEWLFPRMSAVVHHAGAGTTAAGLRAGVPSVSVPVLADQPFWGHRMTKLGVGPAPVPFRRLSVERLATAMRSAVTSQRYRATAARLGRAIEAEDGAGRVLTAVERLARPLESEPREPAAHEGGAR